MDTQEKKIYTAIIIGGIVIGVVIYFFLLMILRFHRRQSNNQHKLILFELSLLEEERQRIAQDFHDSYGSLLLATRMAVAGTRGATPRDEELLQKVSGYIHTMSRNTRHIVYNLTPVMLLDKGLQEGLEHLFAHFQELYAIRFQLRFEIASRLPQVLNIHLFRMVQELINNAVKHSEASYVLVQFKEANRNVHLYYRDNGKGIAPRHQTGGSGLKGLENRTQRMGGSMKLRTPKAGGTEYFFTIPIHQTHAPD